MLVRSDTLLTLKLLTARCDRAGVPFVLEHVELVTCVRGTIQTQDGDRG